MLGEALWGAEYLVDCYWLSGGSAEASLVAGPYPASSEPKLPVRPIPASTP